MKVLIIGGLPRSLTHFRGPLIRAMAARGHVVSASANGHDPETENGLAELDVDYHPVRLDRAGVNPATDVVTVCDLIRLVRLVKPDLVFSYTIKPVVYGTFAARLCGVRRVFAMVEGAGHAFMPCESLSHFASSCVAKCLYRLALPWNRRVLFVNPDDRRQFSEQWYVRAKKTAVINGMGVDLVRYGYVPPKEKAAPSFFMAARLLKAKGVREYAEAARLVKVECGNAQFRLAGSLDANPSSVKQVELDGWSREGAVEYLGQLPDVRPAYADCSVFVLPSHYREGTPQVNLEAMAMGRPIITTDGPGCRETVLLAEEDKAGGEACDVPLSQDSSSRQRMHEWARTRGLKIGANGILVPPRNVEALVAAMQFFIDNPDQIAVMGRASRRYAEDRYDVHKVNATMLETMGL